jgi:hypothetical protein
MDVVVDLSTGDLSLDDPADLRHFAVVARSPHHAGRDAAEDAGPGALGALAAALSLEHAGLVEPDGTVRIFPDAVRGMARGVRGLPDDWEAGFVSMLDAAATKGWIGDDGSILAHVEWRSVA